VRARSQSKAKQRDGYPNFVHRCAHPFNFNPIHFDASTPEDPRQKFQTHHTSDSLVPMHAYEGAFEHRPAFPGI
jgi:hypothetical protein